MSDEIKNPETETAENDISAAEAPAAEQPQEDGGEALNAELNNLRDMFQQEWDKTVKEAEDAPPIQELDYAGAPEEEPEEPAAETPAETEAAPAEEKPKKEKKKRGKAPLIILIVLLVLILIPLLAYVILTIKVPSLNSFISAYTSAYSATEATDKINYYQDALTYCTDDTPLKGFKQSILEEIVVLTNETQGYAAALDYADANLTDEMRANPESEAFKSFLEIGDKIGKIADTAYDVVKEAYDAVNDAAALDYDSLTDKLQVPDLIRPEVTEALKSIAAGLEAEKTAEEKGSYDEVMTAYMTAVQSFKTMGADGQKLLETAAVKLYNAGYVYETTVLLNNFTEDMLADTKLDEFKSVVSEIDALRGADADLYAVALALFENNTTNAEDIKSAINVKLNDTQKNALVKVTQKIIEGLKYEKEKNLTMARDGYIAAIGTVNALELPTASLAQKLIELFLVLGDDQSAQSVRENYVTEVMLADDSNGLKAAVEKIDAIYSAESAINEIFYPFYYNAYYSGAEMNKEEINAALDEALTEDADVYTVAYVNYFKYLAEGFTDADNVVMRGYLEEFAKAFADYPAFYASYLAETYRMNGEWDEAEKIADRCLEINVADDYAIGIKSMAKRIAGDVDGARKTAKDGIALAGDSASNCAREALICDILSGDWAEAYTLAKQLYDESLTMDNCEYILIVSALAEGLDDETQKALTEAADNVTELFAQYELTPGDNAQELIDGTLTPAEVFLEEPYYLR